MNATALIQTYRATFVVRLYTSSREVREFPEAETSMQTVPRHLWRDRDLRVSQPLHEILRSKTTLVWV